MPVEWFYLHLTFLIVFAWKNLDKQAHATYILSIMPRKQSSEIFTLSL